MSDEKSLESIFQKKYNEFCDDLAQTYSEKSREIAAARALSERERMTRFRAEVMPVAGNPTRNPQVCPGVVLPGVMIETEHWATFSPNSQKAIQEYITLLSFTCMFGDTEHPWTGDLSGNDTSKAWMDDMLKQWKDKLNKVDFKSLTEKMMNLFGGGNSPFQLPEQFLKGQLAKLAEELVREFRPEDFGLTPEQLGETDTNPSRAFELLMNIYTQKPEILQNAMKRIAKRLQEKIRKGELRPQEIAAEAEEMMKQFTDNPAFVELMESFRSAFGFEDTEMARAAGRDGDGRLALARQRLRAKLEKKKNAKK
jgi:polyhydroxyalkanoate synthesis regulator phasin